MFGRIKWVILPNIKIFLRRLQLGPTHDNEMLMYVIALVYIHRSWFAEALRDSQDPLEHEYGQSVISIYRSANILIHGMRSLCTAYPKEAGRVWFFWSCFYTSSVRMYDQVREYHAHRRISIKDSTGRNCSQVSWLQARPPCFDFTRRVLYVVRRRVEAVSPARNRGMNQPICFARKAPLPLKTIVLSVHSQC